MGTVNTLQYFIGDNGECKYNAKCMSCTQSCKQSYRSTIVVCPVFCPKK